LITYSSLVAGRGTTYASLFTVDDDEAAGVLFLVTGTE
jgi:hypothetical protein